MKWQDTLVSQWLNFSLGLLTLTTSWTVWTTRHLSWSAWPGSVPTAPLCVACFFAWCGLSLSMRVQSGTPAPRLTVFVSTAASICGTVNCPSGSPLFVFVGHSETNWMANLGLEASPLQAALSVENFEWTWASVSSRKHASYCRWAGSPKSQA